MTLKPLQFPSLNTNQNKWVKSEFGYTRPNPTTQQTEFLYNPTIFDGAISNKTYSPIPLPEETIVNPLGNLSNTSTIAQDNVVVKPISSNNNNNQTKTSNFDFHARNMEGAGKLMQGIGSVANIGLGIWNAIEQSKLNKEQIANMQAQREMWSEQISASREARTQRREELARLNKMRSNTKAQFNTQSRVSRSY